MKDLIIDNENKIYKAILFCMDNDNETRYTTIILDEKQQSLELKFTHFNRLLRKSNIDCSFTFIGEETKKFIHLFAQDEQDFIKTIKEKYSNLNAHTELIAIAKQNNIKYRLVVYNKSNPNYCRYDFGQIVDDTSILYYENGELIVPDFYEHCENGITKIYTHDGFLHMELKYKNGKLNGKAKCYFKKTKLICWENNYVDDKLDGKNFRYFRNGKVEQFDTFVMGVKEGLDRTYNTKGIIVKEEMWKSNDKTNVKIFSNDGNPKQETNYKKDKKEGIEKLYDEKGYLEEESNYSNNMREGLCKKYYPNGQLKHEAYFKKGLQEGKTKQYFENGQLELENTFKNDEAHGTARYYYKNGKLDGVTRWKKGKEEGYSKHYYDTGELKYRIFYVHGLAEKEYKEYYKSGKIKKITPYHKDNQEGISKGFYENGNIKIEYSYKNGEKDGTCKTYYEDGKIRSSIEYKNGLRDGFSIFYKKETSNIALKMLFQNGKFIDFYDADGIKGYFDKEESINFFRELKKLSKVNKKIKQDFPFYEELKDFINDYN